MRLMLAAMILGASGIGYLKYNDNPAGATGFSGLFTAEEGSMPTEEQLDELAEAGTELHAVSGPEIHDFAEIFRFDLSPNHVMERWEQVSAGLSELSLQGYRVPLVTGIDDTDLAGSLTYYFDPSHRMRRITFTGTTGNPRRLVRLLTQHYRFQRVVTRDPRRENYSGGQRGESYCTITPSDLIDQHNSRTQFGIQLRIER